MSTTHDRKNVTILGPRPARCLRHHVWLAACDDCCRARADLLAGRPRTPAAR